MAAGRLERGMEEVGVCPKLKSQSFCNLIFENFCGILFIRCSSQPMLKKKGLYKVMNIKRYESLETILEAVYHKEVEVKFEWYCNP